MFSFILPCYNQDINRDKKKNKKGDKSDKKTFSMIVSAVWKKIEFSEQTEDKAP